MSFLTGVLGYIMGSFPTAYVVVRLFRQIDIRRAGSGNVGTLNSMEVTGSVLLGGLVLVIDMLKGAGAVLLAHMVAGNDFSALAAGAGGAVLGHNFPIWLKGEGGRGLATSAGALAILGWVVVPAWGLLWLLAYLLLKKVTPANAIATGLILILAIVLPAAILEFVAHQGAPVDGFRLFVVGVMLLILVRHIAPVLDYLRSLKASKGGGGVR
jgi:acyl phosphate:glycerol-3-phosphate acyltransferase